MVGRVIPVEQPPTGVGDRRWRDLAACLVADPELFFPVAERGPVRDAQEARAKAVCADCPVRAACLAWALNALPYGVAGGLSAAERRTHRRRSRVPRRRAVPVTPCPEAGEGPEVARNGTRAERVDAATALVERGRPCRVVAAVFGVSERTVSRWLAEVRTANTAVPVGCGTDVTAEGRA